MMVKRSFDPLNPLLVQALRTTATQAEHQLMRAFIMFVRLPTKDRIERLQIAIEHYQSDYIEKGALPGRLSLNDILRAVDDIYYADHNNG